MNHASLPVATVLAMLALTLPARPQGPTTGSGLDVVLRDWAQRQKKTSAVLYQAEGTTTVTKGAFSEDDPTLAGVGPVPREDHTSKLSLKYMLDFQKGRARKEKGCHIFFLDLRRFLPDYRVEIFDGTEMTTFQPSDKMEVPPDTLHIDLSIRDKKGGQMMFNFADLPVFLAHGIVPSDQAPLPQSLRLPLDPGSFQVTGKGIIKNSECVIVRSVANRPRVEYWVDLARQSAVLRATVVSNDRPSRRAEIEYQRIEWGWVPSRWTITHFTGHSPPQVWQSESAQVIKVTLDPTFKDSDFHLEMKPGMIVWDATMPKETYKVSSEGELVPLYKKSGTGTYLYVLLAILVVLLIASLGFFYWKRKQHKVS